MTLGDLRWILRSRTYGVWRRVIYCMDISIMEETSTSKFISFYREQEDVNIL